MRMLFLEKGLGLEIEEHPHSYKLTWLKKGNGVRVTKRCMFALSIRRKYQDKVLCDVVKMVACHLFLGKPWKYDRQTIHDGRRNTYSLYKKELNIADNERKGDT